MLLHSSSLNGQEAVAVASRFVLFLMCNFIQSATSVLCFAIMQAVRVTQGLEVTEQEAVSREGKESKRKPQVGGTAAW